jgi:Na+/melibiose symporter-like transporter
MPAPENPVEESAATPSPYHGAREMLLLGMVAATFNVEISLTSNVVPITCRHFTDSAFLIAAILSSKRLFGSLIQPWASWRSDFVRTRFGRRRPFLLVGLPCTAFALLALGLMPVLVRSDSARHSLLALAGIFLINAILQIAVDLNWGVLEPLYADSFRQQELGRASSIRQVASNLLVLFMVTFVIGWADVNELYPYLFGAGAYLVAFGIARTAIKERPTDLVPPSSRYHLGRHLGLILRSRDLLKLAVVCTANLALPAAISLLMPLYVTETLGLSMGALGSTQILGTLLSVVLAFPLGWLIDWLGPKWVMAAGFALFALVSTGLSFWTHDYQSLLVAMTVFGIAQTVALIPMTALVFQYCSARDRGQIFGVIQFIRAFSTFLISITLGSMTQLAPSYEDTPVRAQEIRDLPALTAQLESPPNPAVRFVRDHLSPQSRSLLHASADQSGLLRDSLTADFNRLIDGPAIYSPERFAGLSLSRQSQSLLHAAPAQGSRLAVLNRTLLQDIFAKELSRQVNYRLPFNVSIGLSLFAMLVALMVRPGRFARVLVEEATPV